MGDPVSTIVIDTDTTKYFVTFGGTTIETTVTRSHSTATDWFLLMTALYGGSPTVVGLDVEWRPQFSRRRNRVATLQLCIDDRCLIIQLPHMDEIPESITDFLMDPDFTFVGVGVDADLDKLWTDYGIDCDQTMDVREEALARWPGDFSSESPGLKELAGDLCGLWMEKPRRVRLSDWEAFQLSDAQVEYACIDAFASFSLGEYLISCDSDSDYI